MKECNLYGRIPVKMWADNCEDSAAEQIKNLTNLPFAFHHIAIMPDVHSGYGMPIGGVLATENVILPYAVGSDVGCGMIAQRTSLQEISREQLIKIVEEIKKAIPVGFDHNVKAQDERLMPETYDMDCGKYPIVEREWDSALHQLGTMGSGNHFLEIQKGNDGYIWIMIHSGSRNVGKQVCDYYNKVAIELNNKWYSSVPKEWQLAFLPLNSEEGQDYLREMQWCVEFALANRKLMLDKIDKIFWEVTGEIDFDEPINIAHNYARMEHHYGRDVMVHRKGATFAGKGNIGIIPGSQGTKSYIVEGLGNRESFNSCSHGAGRIMGRKVAQRTLNLEDEVRKMDEQGIIHGMKTVEDLDESISAYKDIDTVMDQQKDLVKILVELKPLAVIKG